MEQISLVSGLSSGVDFKVGWTLISLTESSMPLLAPEAFTLAAEWELFFDLAESLEVSCLFFLFLPEFYLACDLSSRMISKLCSSWIS